MMVDPLEQPVTEGVERPRRHYDLEDLGFDEVPRRYRKFYRAWRGAGDVLAPNEVLCPVCKKGRRCVSYGQANFWTWFPSSLTNTLRSSSTAIPTGALNCPGRSPRLPHVVTN